MNVDNVVSRLRRRKLQGSQAIALEIALLLRHVVSTFKWSHIDQLLLHLKRVGRRLVAAQPRELAAGNVVRRVLKVIREEYADEVAALQHGRASQDVVRKTDPVQEAGETDEEDDESGSDEEVVDSDDEADRVPATRSMATGSGSFDPNTAIHSSILNLLGRPVNEKAAQHATPTAAERAAAGADLKPALIAAIQLVIDEVRKSYTDIATHALDYVHGGETILTCGAHPLTLSFLRHAAEKRHFTVVMTESSPSQTAEVHRAAQTLLTSRSTASANAGCAVVIVPDTAVFAIMPRCNKVILAPEVVLQNGGLLISPGAKSACLSAKHHAVPVVVLAAGHDLSPIYPYGQGQTASAAFTIGHSETKTSTTSHVSIAELIELDSPEQVLPLGVSSTQPFSARDHDDGPVDLGGLDDVVVPNPRTEYVEPEFIDLYVTNLGGNAPAALDRLLADNYDEEDREL